jgi:hypothetical protein
MCRWNYREKKALKFTQTQISGSNHTD